MIPKSVVASFTHDIFIKGCQVNFSIDGPNEVEVTSLYPDERFRTVDECFDDFIVQMNDQQIGEEEEITNPSPVVELRSVC